MSSPNMNTEEFISAVQARTPLWMSKHPQHLNRREIAKLWSEIRSLFDGHDVPQLKKKWKNLKDHFRKELKKKPVMKSGMSGNEVSSTCWQYFDMMSFLTDDMEPEATSGNLDKDDDDRSTALENAITHKECPTTEVATVSSMSETVSVTLESASTASESISTISDSVSNVGTLKRRNKTAAEVRKEFLELEHKKLKLLENKYSNEDKKVENIEKCDDYYFFLSLIPQMKKFSDIQKLKIRNKITQIIVDEAENNSFSERYEYASPPNNMERGYGYTTSEYNDRFA